MKNIIEDTAISMSNKTSFNEIKRGTLYTLFIFATFVIIYTSIISVVAINANDVQKTMIINNEEKLVYAERTIISNKMERLVSDLLYMADSFKLNEKNNEDFSQLEQQWLSFSNRKKIYDQIRFIDLDGNEIIRVNYSENGSYLTQRENLQNKKDRYYFTDTMTLNEKQIYISKLDLNIENNIIEQPVKPMIRLSIPYFDNNGNLKGIIVLNYLANDMLKQLKTIASASQGSIFMLNSNGYWIVNSEDTSKEWAFMYSDKTDTNFQNQFSSEWEKLINDKEGYLVTSNGVFNYTNIFLNNTYKIENFQYSLVLGEGDYYLLSYISPNSSAGKLFLMNIFDIAINIIKNNFYVYLFLLVIAASLGIFITINKKEKAKIKYFSEYDTMTGVYNRRAGFEKLTQLYKHAIKNDKNMCVCFIDINSLKEVNDTLGHDKGDELITSVVNVIKNKIRENDFVARLGGDEFLIVFQDITTEDAENIWNRINNEYTQINETENRNYIISASHGIEAFNLHSDVHIDSIINKADEKMYNEKRLIKKDLRVIRNAH